ncbi:unnamed protein product [Agarophyton chilense]
MHVLSVLDSSFWKAASWYLRLTVVLLDEYLAGTASCFLTYISTLPAEPTSVLWAYHRFGRSALTPQLSPYHMTVSADLYCRKIKSDFLLFQKSLPKHLRYLVSFELFCWASSNVVSRAFGIPPTSKLARKPVEFALFPMLDMANGSVHVPTKILYDDTSDCVRIIIGLSFAPGEQVYVSYGSKSNEDFMFFYGFVEGNNPSNTVTITDFREWMLQLAHKEPSQSSLWDRKLAILKQMGLANKDSIFAFHMDKLDDKLMAALRITIASTHQLDVLERNLDHKPKSKEFDAIDMKNELKAWDAVLEKCHSLRGDLPMFTEAEQQRLNKILECKPCTAAWDYEKPHSDGELLYCHERGRVLQATMERVSHFSKVSKSVGRICTVLVPPSQQFLRTDLFQFAPEGSCAGNTGKLPFSHEDIQALFED